MNEKIVKKILDDLTKGLADHYIIKRPLTETIYVAKLWLPVATQCDELAGPLDFYFLCSADGVYSVAIQVEDTTFSLFILPVGKKAVELLPALKETILPHILQQKTIQRTVLNKAGRSEKGFKEQLHLLMDAGFKIIREDDAAVRLAIQQSDRIEAPYIHGKNTAISLPLLAGYILKLQLFQKELTIMKQAAILMEGDLSLAEYINDVMDQCQSLAGKLSEQRLKQMVEKS